ncbi:hypothetical protein [Fervidobacterium changbaicum]|uniref:hypothetical protein n=1 Tax=Fervidobacterium TaxID=2422 RepID=UPI0038B2DEBD
MCLMIASREECKEKFLKSGANEENMRTIQNIWKIIVKISSIPFPPFGLMISLSKSLFYHIRCQFPRNYCSWHTCWCVCPFSRFVYVVNRCSYS